MIHQEYATALASFQGDASAFEGARPHLKRCLLGGTGRPKKSVGPLVGAVAFLALALIAIGLVIHHRNSQWAHYLETLNHTPGIVVSGAERSWLRYWVWGMRDPLSADPVQLAAAAGIPTSRLEARFASFESLDAQFRRSRDFDLERRKLEAQVVLFPVNSAVLTADQAVRLDNIEEALDKLQATADKLGRKIHVVLYGRADRTGADSKNTALSAQRADSVKDALRDRGIPDEMLSTVGLGDTEPIRHGSGAYQLELNRSVVLKVQAQPQGDKR